MPDNSSIRNFLNHIDLYGLTFPLRYKKNNSYNTICGIILSSITIFGICGVLIFFLIETINRKEISIISNTENYYGKRLINFANYPLLIGYLTINGIVEIDPSYLTIKLDKNDHYPYKNENGALYLRRESTSIKLEKCKIDIHFNDSNIKEMIEDFEYENYLCPVPGQNLSIGGRWSDNLHGYDILEFHVIKCENTSEKQNCKSPEEMKIFFQNTYLNIIYLSQSLDHYNVKNPIKLKFRSEIFSIVTNVVKRYYYYFVPGKYISDNGYFFNNYKTFDFFQNDRIVIDFVDGEEQSFYSGSTIAEVCFSSIDKFITYKRKYSKFQDSLGNIGSWIKIILVICQVINNYFSEKIFLGDIINFISPVHKKGINSLKIKKNDNFDSMKINNFIKEENNINLKLNSSVKSTIKENKNEKLSFSNLPISNDKFSNKNYLDHPKIIQLNFFEYFLPLWLMEKKNKYSCFVFYKNFIYKYISLEVIIPLNERLLKFHLFKKRDNDGNFLTKLSFIDSNMIQ